MVLSAIKEKFFASLPEEMRLAASGTVCLNAANQILLLSITMLLTRMMPLADFGLYAFALACFTLAILPFKGGLSSFTVKYVAIYAPADPARAAGFIRRWSIVVPGAALLLGLILWAAAVFFFPQHQALFQFAPFFLVLSAALIFAGAVIQGLHHIVRGRVSESFIQPALFLTMLGVFYFSGVADVPAWAVFALQIVSLFVAASLALYTMNDLMPRSVKVAAPLYEDKNWIKSALPMILAAALLSINTQIDTVMVGIVAGAHEAGLYRVASRLPLSLIFFLIVSHTILAPHIARLYQTGRKERLQIILLQINKLVFHLTLIPAFIMALLPGTLLSTFFGGDYAAGKSALLILVAGQMVNITMGLSGQVMLLTGNEKFVAMVAALAVAFNICLNLLLVPIYGINGAAAATSLSLVLWNILLAWGALQKTGLRTSFLLAAPRHKKSE